MFAAKTDPILGGAFPNTLHNPMMLLNFTSRKLLNSACFSEALVAQASRNIRPRTNTPTAVYLHREGKRHNQQQKIR